MKKALIYIYSFPVIIFCVIILYILSYVIKIDEPYTRHFRLYFTFRFVIENIVYSRYFQFFNIFLYILIIGILATTKYI